MAVIEKVLTVLPEYTVTGADLNQVSQSWLAGSSEAQEKFLRISANSGVSQRKFIMPYDQILGLSGLTERAQCFEEYGVDLLTRAIETALEQHQQDPNEVGALVFTSCSVPVIPSIDAAAILRSSLPTTISRVPIFQHGCAGGVVGLGLGAKLATLGKPVLVTSVELCSLVFQPQNCSGAHLVGASIFADGAAATLIRPGEADGLEFVASESHLLPETRHLMGYDIFDDGFHLRLDRALPSALIAEAPTILNDFLGRHGLTAEEIDYWLFHPGGIKILNFLRKTFEIELEQCHWSYDVLREHGNLSSATILYVLDAFLRDNPVPQAKNTLVLGIGPGLTIEMILLRN